MLVIKTIRIPVHYSITTHKISILNSLTARTTYGVWTWSELFREHKLKGSYADRRLFHARVKEQAKLSGAITQCCFDTAAWMWRGYREAHKAWRREVAVARRDGDRKWLRKLLRRQPREPFSNGIQGKVPIWFDNRIGSIERAKHLKLCSYVARVSTLRRGVKLTIPLNPAKYHLDLLQQSTVKSFQLVKRDGKYYVHQNRRKETPAFRHGEELRNTFAELSKSNTSSNKCFSRWERRSRYECNREREHLSEGGPEARFFRLEPPSAGSACKMKRQVGNIRRLKVASS